MIHCIPPGHIILAMRRTMLFKCWAFDKGTSTTNLKSLFWLSWESNLPDTEQMQRSKNQMSHTNQCIPSTCSSTQKHGHHNRLRDTFVQMLNINQIGHSPWSCDFALFTRETKQKWAICTCTKYNSVVLYYQWSVILPISVEVASVPDLWYLTEVSL